MRKLTYLFTIICALCSDISTQAQVIWLKPQNPSVNDSVTLFYNAAEGNQALKDYKGDVYLHTGVITNKSLDGHDWKYVVGNWGADDKRVIMKREGSNLYSYRFIIKQLYNLRPEDIAQQLAYVFRNADGTLVGKTKENEDIVVPVNNYKPKTAAATAQNKQEHQLQKITQTPSGWDIAIESGDVRITPFSGGIVEVTYLPFGTTHIDPSHAVIMQPEKVEKNMDKTAYGYLLQAGEMKIVVGEKPFYLTYIFKGDTLLSEESGFYKNNAYTGVRLKLADNEKVFGAGERAIDMDRRGKLLQLYNRPFYAYEMGATMLNYSVPLTFSSRKYAFLFDNPQKGYVDIGFNTPDVTEWAAMGGTARYYVIAGSAYPEISYNYTQLTGRQALPPRWALGNLQSRMAYRTQQETEHVVDLMQAKDFPIDAIILDFYWFGDSIQGHLGKLDWYKPAWPAPEAMISKFKTQGVKTILITEPYVIDTVANHADAAAKGVFVTDSLGNPYLDKQFYFGTGSLIDIFKPEAREWFWQKYKAQIDKGIAGWWGDLGEPESHPADIRHVTGKANEVHNIFGHYWDKMLFEKYAENYPNTRLFHLQRSGFAGSQRYSAYPWTGDVSRSWGGLQAQLPLLLTMSINGLGYIHSDAGGFAQGLRDDELYTRWLQFAVFTPILRPHGSGIPSEPVFWNEKTQDIVRRYMKLRYALLPYNYTLAWQNATTGEPLIRPMFYAYPNEKTSWKANDQYLWGDNILVAPIVQKGLATREIFLPEGKWYDFNTGKVFEGGKTINYELCIENIPVFAKAGSFIPMTEPVNSTDNYKADNYTVRYYPYGTSKFVQYEDNGLDNFALTNGKHELITYKGSLDAKRIVVEISKSGTWDNMPTKRNMTIEIYTQRHPVSFTLNKKKVYSSQMGKRFTGKKPVYTTGNGILKVNFTWDGKPQKLEIVTE